ncbi:MAG: SDR family NAD(P)-dependent oxidoreductase [Desulfobacterales bacterium]|nr:SDR family NAD(P)-dependent oxidoreductase [Desulfobacterales bacterium]
MNEISQRLVGKVAIVTGSGRGIGRCEALQLAACGAAVVVSDMGVDAQSRQTASLVTQEIRASGGQAVAVTENLMTTGGVKKTIDAAVEAFGGLDILVNNAGLRGGGPIDKLTDDQWDRVVDSHLKVSFMLIREAVPQLKRRGGGVIINTGSEAGLGMVFNAAYAAAKEGLAGLTRSVAREQGRFNIRCNLIRPRAISDDAGGGDWFQTNMRGKWRPLVEALGPHWMGDRGLHGFDGAITSDSVAALVAWLCTPAAEHLNGQDFYIAGTEFSILTSPRFEATFTREENWDMAGFDKVVGPALSRIRNEYRIRNPLLED